MQVALLFFFVVYVLVGSMILFAIFWNDPRFFWLAAINFCSFVLFFVAYRVVEKKKQALATPSAPEKEKTVEHVHVPTAFVKHPAFHKKHSFFPKKYLLWMLVAIFLFVSVMAFRTQIVSISSFVWEQGQELFVAHEPITSTYMTGEWEVLGTGLASVVTGNIFIETGEVLLSGSTGANPSSSGNVFVGDEVELVDTGVVATGEVLGEGQDVDLSADVLKKLGLTDSSAVSMMDAIVYLLDTHSVPLVSSKVKFTYVTSKNTYYSYWATAYQKHIIGIATNPSSKISCETYQVFKGMIAGWKVKYTSATVKSAFWAEAKKRDELKGCAYGVLLKGKNL